MRKTSDLIWQDKQHQVLFELIDQLKLENVSSEIFTRLTEYAESHFSLEEEYMVKLKYPGVKEHIEAHNKFRKELNDMITHQHVYDETLRQSLSLFLTEWLKLHVFGIDKKLEQFIWESEFK